MPWLVGLFLLGVLGGLGYLAWVLFRTPTHEVPAVVGLPQDEALALVDDFEWEITVDDGRSDEYRTPRSGHPARPRRRARTSPKGRRCSSSSPKVRSSAAFPISAG